MRIRTFLIACMSSTFKFRALLDRVLCTHTGGLCDARTNNIFAHMTKMRTGNRASIFRGKCAFISRPFVNPVVNPASSLRVHGFNQTSITTIRCRKNTVIWRRSTDGTRYRTIYVWGFTTRGEISKSAGKPSTIRPKDIGLNTTRMATNRQTRQKITPVQCRFRRTRILEVFSSTVIFVFIKNSILMEGCLRNS